MFKLYYSHDRFILLLGKSALAILIFVVFQNVEMTGQYLLRTSQLTSLVQQQVNQKH